MSFHTFGQTIVVLNNVKAVKDLLEKRGDIYSDRPLMTFYEMWALEYLMCRVSADANQDGLELDFAGGKK